MRKFALLFVAIVMCVFVSSSLTPAFAQATRTWVSGVGDDANPCSRTAPCKTFAGAISKTATNGEINCLDPGGFGALTITKSIAIICQIGTAGVLVSGTNGIVIAGTGPLTVYLQGLDFEGVNSGLTAILFNGGSGSLYVKDCIIRGFTRTGIDFAPSGAGTSFLAVDNTVVADQVVATPNGGGILVAPTGGAVADGLVTNTRMVHNLYGLRVQDNAKVTANDSVASNNSTNGFISVSTSAAASLSITRSVSSNNGTNGVATNGGNASVQLANVSIFGNATGINTGSGGTVSGTTPGTTVNTSGGAPNGGAASLQ